MPAHMTRPPLRTRLSASGTKAPTGAKMIAASRGSGGASAEPPGEILAGDVAVAGEGEDRPALGQGDLRKNMRGGSEAVHTDASVVARHAIGTVADKAGAKQWCRVEIVESAGQRKAEARVGDAV
jgi:hypothetical protein